MSSSDKITLKTKSPYAFLTPEYPTGNSYFWWILELGSIIEVFFKRLTWNPYEQTMYSGYRVKFAKVDTNLKQLSGSSLYELTYFGIQNMTDSTSTRIMQSKKGNDLTYINLKQNVQETNNVLEQQKVANTSDKYTYKNTTTKSELKFTGDVTTSGNPIGDNSSTTFTVVLN